MKTAGFILVVCSLISISISAQTKLNQKSDSLLIKNHSIQHILNDTLNLNIPFGENNLQSPIQKNKLFAPNQDMALIHRNGERLLNQKFRMPVYNPRFQSNMPVVKLDSAVHYHLLIKKIRK